MKKHAFFTVNASLLSAATLLISTVARAQQSVEINGQDAGSWLKDHWIWVAAGAVVLILLIALLSGGSRSKTKTTIVKETDADGFVRTTTTEIRE